jgi:hypothetical protein
VFIIRERRGAKSLVDHKFVFIRSYVGRLVGVGCGGCKSGYAGFGSSGSQGDTRHILCICCVYVVYMLCMYCVGEGTPGV